RPRRRRRTAAATADGGTIQVVVNAGAGRAVGLVVGRILDIAEETVTARADATRPGVLFTAVVQDRVTEFLDVEHVVRGGRGG
ncbi:MAG: hypothetical protein K2P78_04930, partial [Gemmataceae bacterium]|nr:hypothetical protein [Gemmataceae bacterium]MBY0513240.1 hypothetical protein [Gemmataceae bacterium]